METDFIKNMEEIKKTLSTVKQWFGIFWAIPIIIVLVRELLEDGNGSLADNASVVYSMETATILLTCLNVPLALKLFSWVLTKKIDQIELIPALKLYKKWSLVRLLFLFVPVFLGLATYYMCMSTTGILCAAIVLTASLFCVPSEKNLKQDLKIE